MLIQDEVRNDINSLIAENTELRRRLEVADTMREEWKSLAQAHEKVLLDLVSGGAKMGINPQTLRPVYDANEHLLNLQRYAQPREPIVKQSGEPIVRHTTADIIDRNVVLPM